MPPRTRTPSASPTPRVPTDGEAQVLTVYADAERALLETVRDETGAVADLADAGNSTAARQLAGARKVRQAVESAVRDLNRDTPGRVDAVVTAAARQGVDEAARQLSAITGRGDTSRGATIDRRALDRLAASTLDLAQAGHASILRTVPDAYRDIIIRTLAPVLVGAQTRRDAAQRAMWALTDRGITSFTDSAGRRWRLSSYVEMAVRTAAARAHVDAQLDHLAAEGFDLVAVDGSAGECDRCSPWVGRVLAQSGRAGRRTITRPGGRSVQVDVAGTVAQARAAGLLHPNCRCALGAYQPGMTRLPVRTVDPAAYAATQRQRDIERHIRAWKERQAAALDPAAHAKAAAKVKGWQAAMRGHLKANPDLRRLTYREGIDAGNAPTAPMPLPPAIRAADLTSATPDAPDPRATRQAAERARRAGRRRR